MVMSLRYKKVLLINPPESGQGSATAAPLGLMYIAAVLQKAGIEVRILDAFLEGWPSVKAALEAYGPDLVGVACQTYARVPAVKVAGIVKEYQPGLPVIFGGHHPTLMPRQVLGHYTHVDFICIGEGEPLMLELCQGVPLADIAGLGYRKEGACVINQLRTELTNLDELPMPAWDLVDPRRYGTNCDYVFDGVDLSREPGANITYSRGCIGRCNFCSSYQMWKKWKFRSPQNVIAEMELLNKKYGIRCFQFNDDCFSVNKQATLDFCRLITERGMKIYFSIVTRTDCVDEEILRALKAAGCYAISFGIETASPRLLKIIHKPIKIERSLEAIRLVNTFGIRSLALIIAGNVGETIESINETIDFLQKAQPTAIGVANGLMLFPGTEVYRNAVKQGFISDDFWLSDYNWKVYTAEVSRLRLNIYVAAIHARRKLFTFFPLNALQYHRFFSREVGIAAMGLLGRLGWRRGNGDKPKLAK